MKANKILGTALLVGMLSACTHTYKHTVYFDTGSSKINAANKAELMKAVEKAKSGKAKVTISGHADAKGSLSSNIKLSDKRAMSASKELAKLGVDEKKVTKVASTKDSVAAKGNYSSTERRVDIVIKK